MAKFKWIDRGLNGILQNVKFLSRNNVRVGIVGSAGDRMNSAGRLTLGELALIHEFGSATVPRRSFIRSALRSPEAEQLALKLVHVAITFGDVNAALRVAGEGLAEVMRRTIREGKLKRNKPETIRRKGSQIPLLDTGMLVDAIGYEVVTHNGTRFEAEDKGGERGEGGEGGGEVGGGGGNEGGGGE